MKRVLIFLLSLFLLSFSALAAEDDPPVSATDITLDISEYLDTSEPAGEWQYEDLYFELEQLRAVLYLIFWGVIAMGGVVTGCFIGVMLTRLWGV